MSDAPPPRKWIPREAYRQEKAVVWARNAIRCPHKFFAFDRSKPQGDRSHLYQARRGVRRDTLDTMLAWTGMPVWFEFKAGNGKVDFADPDDGQAKMICDLAALGHFAGWGKTILEMCQFYEACGVILAPNAEFLALHYDGLVDSRIARAERAQGTVKRPSQRKAAPRYAAPKRMWGKLT